MGLKPKRTKFKLSLSIGLAFVLICSSISQAAPPGMEWITSKASSGQANQETDNPSITDDGRYIAFQSEASNLVSDDTNMSSSSGATDIFVYDRDNATIVRVSVASDGTQANNVSFSADIAAAGRYVAFHSFATNLVASDTNSQQDVFVHDMQTEVTERVSLASDATQGNGASHSASISSDGRYVAFVSSATNLVIGDTNGQSDIFVYDRNTDTIERVSLADDESEANNSSSNPTISADGTVVAFISNATNLVAGDTNGANDVFVRNLSADTTIRASVATDGTQHDSFLSRTPSISSDGRYVVFDSSSSLLVASDTNSTDDVFLRDTQTSTTTRVSLDSSESQANGASYDASISTDGGYVSFTSGATNLVAGDTNAKQDIFLRNLSATTTTRVSVTNAGAEGDDGSQESSISDSGAYIAFASDADEFGSDFNGYEDVFLRNVSAGTTTQVKAAADYGNIGTNGDVNDGASISSDGRYVAFVSRGDNMVELNTKDRFRVFVKDRDTNTNELISIGYDGSEQIPSTADSIQPMISPNGRYVLFQSDATNLVTGDTNAVVDIFLYDRNTDTTERVSVQDNESEFSFSNTSASMSSDANLITFEYNESGAYAIYVRNRQAGTTTLVDMTHDSSAYDGGAFDFNLSQDGQYLFFTSNATNHVASDTNGAPDVFRIDLEDGNPATAIDRISVTDAGAQASGFFGGGGYSANHKVSATGRYVTFLSNATNLVSGDSNGTTDVFVVDLEAAPEAESVERVNITTTGAEANAASQAPVISGDGRWVAFTSSATNLVPSDTNSKIDAFLVDLNEANPALAIQRISESTAGVQGNDHTFTRELAISNDGAVVMFASQAYNLVSDDVNEQRDYFLAVMTEATPPTVVTNAATSITTTTATLNGNITDVGSSNATSRGFEYGLTISYGSTVSESGNFGNGSFSSAVSGLTCDTLYHFRATATSPDGTGNGADLTFTTSSCPLSGSISGSNPQSQNSPPSPPAAPPSPPPSPEAPLPPNTAPIYSPSSDKSNNKSKEEIPIAPPPNQTSQGNETETPPSAPITPSVNFPVLPSTGKMIDLALILTLLPLLGGGIGVLANPIPPLLAIGQRGFFLFGVLPRKKWRYWGTVYDSTTKRPIPFAKVEVVGKDGRVLVTTFTNFQGMYGLPLSPDESEVTLRAIKEGYTFPSTKPITNDHLIYERLYFGAVISTLEVLNLDIPIDPTSTRPHDFSIKLLLPLVRSLMGDAMVSLFWVALVVDGILVAKNPNPFHIAIFSLLLLVGIARMFNIKPKPYGEVVDKSTHMPIPFVLVAAYDKEDKKISFCVSDEMGRYILITEKAAAVVRAYTPANIEPPRSVEVKPGKVKGYITDRIVL